MKTIKQTVLKKLNPKEKKKEGIYLLIGFGLFFFIYFLSLIIGNFAWMGYLAAVVVVYLLYRTILYSNIRYDYQISEGRFLVICKNGRKKEILCDILLTQVKGLRKPGDKEANVTAIAGDRDPDNLLLLWEEGETERSLLFAPNDSILRVIKTYCKG